VALAVFSTELMHSYAYLPPGAGWGALGGLAYALAQWDIDSRKGFPEGHSSGLYLAQAIVRVIPGAIVGAVALAVGGIAAFVAGLAGPAALVGFGAKFGRRKQRPGGKEAAPDATHRPNSKPRT